MKKEPKAYTYNDTQISFKSQITRFIISEHSIILKLAPRSVDIFMKMDKKVDYLQMGGRWRRGKVRILFGVVIFFLGFEFGSRCNRLEQRLCR